MKKFWLFALFFSSPIGITQAAWPVIVISDDEKSALINILDNPDDSAEEWLAGRLFEAMAGISGTSNKRVANENMSIACEAVTTQPSGDRFGNCKIRLKASSGIRISKALNAVDVQLQGEAARTFRRAFVPEVTSTEKFSFGIRHGLMIESLSPESFDLSAF